MVQVPSKTSQVIYPESDGQPMADNTKQYRWIVHLAENLKYLLRGQTAFVAADLFWYPVESQANIVSAPDVLVALGRPDGDRGSYKQWEEAGVAPQVVFEIISPSNTAREIIVKQAFYEEHGVLEMFFYDPDSFDFWGLVRQQAQDRLYPIGPMHLPWTSATLGIRFEMFTDGLAVFFPDGQPFQDLSTIYQERNQAQQERDQAQQERDQAQQERDRAWAKLRDLGIDIDPQQI